MNISDALLPEFDHEMATTRKLLERVPEGKLDWQPHEKSMKLGQLSTHIAEMPTWAGMTINRDSLDIAPVDGPSYVPKTFNTTEDLLAYFDGNVKEAREVLANTSNEKFFENWSLLAGGQTLFTLPKIAVIRTWVMNHAIHHRGQLSVYLRLNDVAVPSIYGPSADDSGGM